MTEDRHFKWSSEPLCIYLYLGLNIGFLDADPLPRDERDTPYFIVRDYALTLMTLLTKPFCGRNLTNEECVFNCRLSRARSVVENAFGILANHFRCLLTTIAQNLYNVLYIYCSGLCDFAQH